MVLGLQLSGGEELQHRNLRPVAAGDATCSYALFEREAGSDAAAMLTRAVRDVEAHVLTGTKAWISQAGLSTHHTVMAVTKPRLGAKGISAFVLDGDDPGFNVGAPKHKMRVKGFILADVATKTEAARQPAYVAAAKADRGASDFTFANAAAKRLASDTVMQAAVDAVQLFGGAGYTTELRVERHMQDAKITQPMRAPTRSSGSSWP